MRQAYLGQLSLVCFVEAQYGRYFMVNSNVNTVREFWKIIQKAGLRAAAQKMMWNCRYV